MARIARESVRAALVLSAVCCAVGLSAIPAAALVPLPEYVTFVQDGALKQVSGGDTAAAVLVDPWSLPADGPEFAAPLEVVGHWWAPDGTHVAVGVRDASGESGRLFICDDNGASPVQVMAWEGTYWLDPAAPEWTGPELVWSPDGSRLALTIFEYEPVFGDIFAVELDGTASLVGAGVDPAWSPDGTYLAYTRAVAGAAEVDESQPYVGVGDVVSGEYVELGVGRMPVFSPDGSQVLYKTWVEDPGTGMAPEQLVVAPAAGGEGRMLTAFGPFDDLGAAAEIWSYQFSPDGSKAYFMLGRRSDWRYVWEVPTDGSGEPVMVSGLATEFTLSPDGTRLVYTSGEIYDGNYQTRQQVYARDLASCAEWQLSPATVAAEACQAPSVSHRNRYVAFDVHVLTDPGNRTSIERRDVWIATLDGSHTWQVATGAYDAQCQPMYRFAGEGEDASGNGDDVGPMDDESDSSRTGVFARIGDAVASFFRWLAGLFD